MILLLYTNNVFKQKNLNFLYYSNLNLIQIRINTALGDHKTILFMLRIRNCSLFSNIVKVFRKPDQFKISLYAAKKLFLNGPIQKMFDLSVLIYFIRSKYVLGIVFI